MPTYQDAFISYGRVDSKEFAICLRDRMSDAGLSVWLDLHDIPPAVDWQQQIYDGIDRSHNFLFVISPHSINSDYCRLELEHAIKRHKRIVPLMHVEEISRELWQQRLRGSIKNPEVRWQAYCAGGKHSSYPNMPKILGKLNWTNFREGVDDFEESAQKLLKLLATHRSYVEQHTELLDHALTWKHQQKQHRYLLVGTPRKKAENWLKANFDGEQPPCAPTDLHCEFISESIKIANSLMSQVFLCHAEPDRDSAEQIRRSLLRRGVTVWAYHTDVHSGQNLPSAIVQGIEEADNIVFLLSPHSTRSLRCQKELKLAFDLNKRIIPVKAAPIDPDAMPSALRSLQQIDLADNVDVEDYQNDESDLLRLIATDAAYYSEHKTWLVQALKWRRQQQKSTMLLRGYNLERATAWLKVANSHRHPATDLQRQFIAASQSQPPALTLDVFISYSRVDSDFARELNEALQAQGKSTWFDQESIASGTDFEQEIYRGVESSQIFLFVLSPESVNSEYCAGEVNYASSLHKRVVTVLYREIDPNDLPAALETIQWLNFCDRNAFQTNVGVLLQTLDTDRKQAEIHTKLLEQALSWQKSNHDESLLLRGQSLISAEDWLITKAEIEPTPTGLHHEYIRASRARQDSQKAAEKRLKVGAYLGIAFASVGIVVAIISGSLAIAAEKQRQFIQTGIRLEQAGAGALSRAEFGYVSALLRAMAAGRELEAVVTRTGIEPMAIAEYPAVSPILALQQIKATTNSIPKMLAHRGYVLSANVSLDGTQVVTTSVDGTARVWNLQNDQSIALEGHEDGVTSADFNPDSTQVVTASRDNTARVWNLQNGESIPLKGHQDYVTIAKFSPDGTQVVTASRDGTARVWNVQSGQFTPLEGHDGSINSANFSPDGTQVVTASEDGTARVWDVESGQFTPLEGHQDVVYSAVFNSSGTQVVTASRDGTARVWDVKSSSFVPLEGHQGSLVDAKFSPNGTQVVTASADGTARVWDLQSGQSTLLEGHQNGLFSVSFNSDGTQVATASADGTARVWDLQSGQSTSLKGQELAIISAHFVPSGAQVITAALDGTVWVWDWQSSPSNLLEGHQYSIYSAVFSPDGNRLVTASGDGTARVWDVQSGKFTPLEGHQSWVNSAMFSPDGNQVVTASADGTARVWDVQSGKFTVFEGHQGEVNSASFNHNGTQVVTASEDGTARIWDVQSGQFTPLEGHEDSIRSASFSPDGTQVITVSEDSTARVWDVQSGQSTPLEGHQESIESASFSPIRKKTTKGDGSQVVTASLDGTARVWDLQSGQVTPLEGHLNWVLSASFNPDGTQVVTASEDGTARIWDLKSKQSVLLEGHQSKVYTANFSPDGTQVATKSEDGTVRLWDLQGRQLAIFEGSSVVFSPTGQQVVIVQDKVVRLHKLDTLPELLEWGCQWLHNYLEYGRATDADRELCNLPPRGGETGPAKGEGEPAAFFKQRLNQAVSLFRAD